MSELPRVHLLVDDPRRAAALEKPLDSAGFSVVIHGDASEARRAIAQRPPTERGVLLVTARLPGGEGAVVIADFRRLAPLLPIITLEGNGADASETLHLACLRAGADVYLTSPHSDEVIALQIRALLAFGDRLRMLAAPKRPLTEPPQFTAFSGSHGAEIDLQALRPERPTTSSKTTARFTYDSDEEVISEAPSTREFDAPIPSAAIATPVAPPVDLETMRMASLPSIPAPAGLPSVVDEPPSEDSLEVDLSEFDGAESDVLSSSDLEEIPLVGPNSVRVSQASMIPEPAPEPREPRKESIPPDPKKLDEGW